MARRKKGSDLPIAEAIASLIGLGFLWVYLRDPAAGRALLGWVPLLVLTVAVLGGAFILVTSLTPPRVLKPGPAHKAFDDVFSVASPEPEAAPQAFPKVEFDRRQERVLSVEEKLDRLDWFQFEKVVAMLYSARGCQVERRGGAKPDGGIDLVVKSGHSAEGRFGVQCKFWKAYEVGVRQVRELMGALQDQRISKGVIVSIKGFTDPARELAARNGIELLSKSALVEMLHEARFTPHIRELNAIMESDEKYCARCERIMVLRTSSKDGSKFWGCSGYPRCWFKMKVREC